MKTKEETIAALIKRYQMQQHPEGGWYAETYRHSKAYCNLPIFRTGCKYTIEKIISFRFQET